MVYSSAYPNYGIWYNDANTDQMAFSASNNGNSASADFCINGAGDGTLTARGNLIWHAGNDGSGSGLDADKLDGYHFSDLENRYVNITGDTMTGDLSRKSTHNLAATNNSVSSTIYPTTFNILDAASRISIRLENVVTTTTNAFYLYARSYDSGGTSRAQRGLKYTLSKPDGSNNVTGTWAIDDAASFRTAISVYSKSEVYTKTESEDRYVNVTGDTMTGALTFKILSDTGLIKNTYNSTVYNLIRNHNNGNISFSASGGGLYIGYENTSNQHFNTSGSERLTIVSGGNVGVGTTSPSEKLSVNGWVGTIGNTGWYNITHGGGINMSDTTWVRVYNSKKFYVSNGAFDSIYTSGAFRADGNPYFSSYTAGTPWPYLRICSRASASGTYTTIAQDNWAEFYFQIPAKRNSDSYIYPPMWFFRQYSYNSSGQRLSYYEDYYLPGTNKDRSNNAGYNILTSKNTYVSSGKGYIGGTEITYVNSAGSASSVPWTGVTSQMQGGNEFNIPDSGFGYTGFWINYLPRNSRSNNSTAVTDYHFGNLQKGKAYLNAKGYKMDGSSNSYVLLGGGSHKAISDFSLAGHTHDRLVSQGNLAPETGRTSARGGVYTYNAYS